MMTQDDYISFQKQLIKFAIDNTEGGIYGVAAKLRVRRETVLRWKTGKHVMRLDNSMGVFECIGIESTEKFIKMGVADGSLPIS